MTSSFPQIYPIIHNSRCNSQCEQHALYWDRCRAGIRALAWQGCFPRAAAATGPLFWELPVLACSSHTVLLLVGPAAATVYKAPSSVSAFPATCRCGLPSLVYMPNASLCVTTTRQWLRWLLRNILTLTISSGKLVISDKSPGLAIRWLWSSFSMSVSHLPPHTSSWRESQIMANVYYLKNYS